MLLQTTADPSHMICVMELTVRPHVGVRALVYSDVNRLNAAIARAAECGHDDLAA